MEIIRKINYLNNGRSKYKPTSKNADKGGVNGVFILS